MIAPASDKNIKALCADTPSLSGDDAVVLLALFDLAPLQARTLAKRLDWAQSTLFRCLTSLEDAGLIVTKAEDDPLRRHITLTAEGHALKSRFSNSQ